MSDNLNAFENLVFRFQFYKYLYIYIYICRIIVLLYYCIIHMISYNYIYVYYLHINILLNMFFGWVQLFFFLTDFRNSLFIVIKHKSKYIFF